MERAINPMFNVFKKYRTMNLINPYVQATLLPIQSFVSPPNFDTTSQPVDIHRLFSYYASVDKAYIYSFSDSYNTLNLSETLGVSYRYGYTRSGTDYSFEVTSINNPFSSGDTKRWVIVNNYDYGILCNLPLGSEWCYVGRKCASIKSTSNTYLKYIHTYPNCIVNTFGDAFAGCSSLSGNLIIPDSTTSLGYNSFLNCTSLNGNLVLPNTLSSIGASAFQNCTGLTGELNIPTSITTIEVGTFRGCKFTGSLIIPNSVTTIGGYALEDLTSLSGTLQLSTNLTVIGSYAFRNSKFNGNLIIPNSVTTIGDYAFMGCTSLNGTITISNSLTACSQYMLSGCSSLTGTLTVPNSVTQLGFACFNTMSSISRVIIPANVQSITNYVFQSMTSLTRIDSYKSSPQDLINSLTFNNINRTTCIIHVPVGSLSAYRANAYWNEFTNIIADL